MLGSEKSDRPCPRSCVTLGPAAWHLWAAAWEPINSILLPALMRGVSERPPSRKSYKMPFLISSCFQAPLDVCAPL